MSFLFLPLLFNVMRYKIILDSFLRNGVVFRRSFPRILLMGHIAERRLISNCRSFDEAAAAYIQKYTENGEKY